VLCVARVLYLFASLLLLLKPNSVLNIIGRQTPAADMISRCTVVKLPLSPAWVDKQDGSLFMLLQAAIHSELLDSKTEAS
jgi:hypothetical protein